MKRPWQFVVSLLMIVLLMITAVGMVCHHHDDANAANCTLCHMAIEPAVSGATACGFVLQSRAVILEPKTLFSHVRVSEAAPRAPPA